MKPTNNLINPPCPRDCLYAQLIDKFSCIYIVGGAGRVYEIVHFFRELLVNPPLQIGCIYIVGGAGRVYEIVRFFRELLVNPPLQIGYCSGRIKTRKNPVSCYPRLKLIYKTT